MKLSAPSKLPRFRTRLRTWAGVVVLGFVAAQVLCFVHCHLGNFLSGSARSSAPSCHAAVRPSCCQKNKSQAPAPERGVACSTLQTLFLDHQDPAAAPGPVLSELVLSLLAPSPLDLAGDATPILLPRPARTADDLCTPEVFLGPAFRSLAPPVLS